jgi:hypothetical protein
MEFNHENGSGPGVRLRKPPKHSDKNCDAAFLRNEPNLLYSSTCGDELDHANKSKPPRPSRLLSSLSLQATRATAAGKARLANFQRDLNGVIA